MAARVITQPRPDGPVYSLEELDGRYVLTPFYRESEFSREITAGQAADWRCAVLSCPEGVIFAPEAVPTESEKHHG